MGRFIISAFADEYHSGLYEQLTALNGFGIENIELRFVNGRNVSTLTAAEASNVRRELDLHGIKASAIGSPLGKIALDGDLYAHMEDARRVFENAAILGTDRIRMFSFYPPKDRRISDCRDEVADALSRMLDLADSFGVTLFHENEAKIYGESPEGCLELLELFGGRLKAVFDMGNFALEGYDPVKAYRLLSKHIGYFHIKDALAAGAIVPPGKGEARIYEILSEHIKRCDGDVTVTLEPHLQTFSGLNALTDSKFDNPYKYETPQDAFADAVEKLKELLLKI